MINSFWNFLNKTHQNLTKKEEKLSWIYDLYIPVWVRVCRFKSKVSLNPLPQKVHKYLLESLWHFMCRFNNLWRVKILEQSRHWNLVGSDSGRAGGNFSVLTGAPSVGSLERGFLMPWPPLINSIGASGGIPSYKERKI